LTPSQVRYQAAPQPVDRASASTSHERELYYEVAPGP
jgi:hypothetical protein